MRHQRQVSQEAQQRRVLLQRLADKKQGSRVLLDNSSDSESSDGDARADSPSSFRDSVADVAGIQQSFLGRTSIIPGQQKVLKRLLQQKENLPQADQAQAATKGQSSQSDQAKSQQQMSSTNESSLLDRLSGLAISNNKEKSPQTATKLATAVATKLPDDLPGPSSRRVTEKGKNCRREGADVDPNESASSGVSSEFQLKPKIANMLYKHQTEGVQWLWGLHKMQRGGILGVQLLYRCYDRDLLVQLPCIMRNMHREF